MADIKDDLIGRGTQTGRIRMFRDAGDGTYHEVEGANLYGWDSINGVWSKLLVDTSGNLKTVGGGGGSSTNINAASLAGTATSTSTGNSNAGTLRAVLASDQPAIPVTQSTSPWIINGGSVSIVGTAATSISGTVPVTQSGTWTVQASQSGSYTVSIDPATTGGWKKSLQNSLAGTVSAVSAAAGRLGGMTFLNLNSAPAYVQVFDTTGAVTLGTTVPDMVVPIPANGTAANGAGVVLFGDAGINMANGIKIAATTGATNSTAVTTSLAGSVFYK